MVKNMIIGDSMRLASRDNNDLLELKEVSDEKRSKWIATRTAPARQRVLGVTKAWRAGSDTTTRLSAHLPLALHTLKKGSNTVTAQIIKSL